VSGYLRVLRQNPDFSRLWLAQVISLLGDWFNTVALSALVSEYTNGSGLAVSGLLIARFLPPMIVSPIAGVLIDRFNRKRLLMMSDVLRAVIVLLLVCPTGRSASGPEHLWLIYAVTVFQFTLAAVFEPGRSAILPSLVKPGDLLRANTLGNVTWSAMLAVGAIVGGVVAAVFGTVIALVIDSISFAISAFLISQIKTRQEPIQDKAARGEPLPTRGGFREGLRYVAQNPPVAAVLFIKTGLSIGSVDSLMIAYATSLFVVGKNGTGSLGILYSAFGIGAIIGPLILNRFNDGATKTMRRLMIVSFAWVTVGWLLFGLAPSLLVAALALMVRAAGGSATWTYSSTILQVSVPDSYLGRVFSLDWAAFYLAITISTLVTGILIDTLGGENARQITIGTGLVSLIPLALWAATVSWLEKTKAAPVLIGD